MDEELGIRADKKIVLELTEKLSKNWHFKNNPPKSPKVLLIGGFQGAGKTTILDLLGKNLDLIVISPDEIRHKLFERGWRVDETFIHTVNTTKNSLLKLALGSGYHIAVDQLTTEVRIELTRDIIKVSQYKLLTVYLKASEEELDRRVGIRLQLPGIYKGTVGELKDSISQYGKPDLSLYDLVLDTEKLTPFEIAEKISILIK